MELTQEHLRNCTSIDTSSSPLPSAVPPTESSDYPWDSTKDTVESDASSLEVHVGGERRRGKERFNRQDTERNGRSRHLRYFDNGRVTTVEYRQRRMKRDDSDHQHIDAQFAGIDPPWEPTPWFSKEDIHESARNGSLRGYTDPRLLEAAEIVIWYDKGPRTEAEGRISLNTTEDDQLEWAIVKKPNMLLNTDRVKESRIHVSYRDGAERNKVIGVYTDKELEELLKNNSTEHHGLWSKLCDAFHSDRAAEINASKGQETTSEK